MVKKFTISLTKVSKLTTNFTRASGMQKVADVLHLRLMSSANRLSFHTTHSDPQMIALDVTPDHGDLSLLMKTKESMSFTPWIITIGLAAGSGRNGLSSSQ